MMASLGKLKRSGEIQNDATHEITKSKMAPKRRFLSTEMRKDERQADKHIGQRFLFRFSTSSYLALSNLKNVVCTLSYINSFVK